MMKIRTKEALDLIPIYDAEAGVNVPFGEAKRPLPHSLEGEDPEYIVVNNEYIILKSLLPQSWLDDDEEPLYETIL